MICAILYILYLLSDPARKSPSKSLCSGIANGQWLMANGLIYIKSIRAVSLYALAEHCALNLFVERDCLARIFVKQD